MKRFSLLHLSPLALFSLALGAQAPDASHSKSITIPGSETLIRIDQQDLKAELSRNGGQTWSVLRSAQTELNLRYARFDPRRDGEPMVPAGLQANPDNRLFIVQFETQVLPEYKQALKELGVERRHVLPHQAYLCRMDQGVADSVNELPFVRWVGDYHVAYKLEETLRDSIISGEREDPKLYDVVMVDDMRDRKAMLAAIEAVGGEAMPDSGQGILQVANLTVAQALELAAHNSVLWMEPLGLAEEDVDQARIQGGANYLESVSGIDGKGMTGMVQEGVYRTHPEFAGNSPYRVAPLPYAPGGSSASAAAGHGSNTAGIIYARGAQAKYKGIIPFAQMLYCNYNYTYNTNNRKAVTQWGVTNHGQSFETASWGYGRTTQYGSRSAEMDDIIFDIGVATTQSQSNANSQYSRPQAWAKNIIAIGATQHKNTATPNDDTSSGASYGPAADGRQKPDLLGYYDSIGTTSGSSGYSTSFGGTSGATPIVNGFVGLTIQMFAEGNFGHAAAPTWQSLDQYTPHFTTTKALLAATSYQYPTTKLGSAAQTRARQGWGFPQVNTMWDQRERLMAIDEEIVLKQGQKRRYLVFASGNNDLRVSMSYADPEASASATVTRLNSVDLQVIAPSGTSYWGNNGLTSLTTGSPANYSAAGGSANDRDTTENVILQKPTRGVYAVEVSAPVVRVDGHVETAGDDVDFGLVVNGIIGSRNKEGAIVDLISNQTGQFDVSLTNVPASGWVDGLTVFSATTNGVAGNGNLFGVELDGLALQSFTQPIGSVFHFAPNAAYPTSTYSFPSALAAALTGLSFDAIALFIDGNGVIVDVSNVDRVTIK